MKKLFQRKKGKQIFASVFQSFTAIVVIMLTLACLFSFNLIRNYILDWQKNELLNEAEQISRTVGETLDWNVLITYQKLIDARIVYVRNDLIAAFEADHETGNKVGDIYLAFNSLTTESDLKMIDGIVSGEERTGLGMLDFLPLEAVYAGMPVYTAEERMIGSILVVRPEDKVSGMLQHIVKNMLVAALIAMVFVQVITSILAKRFTKPLSQMESAARKMAEGDYSTRVSVTKDDEIGSLGETLNVLSEKLEDVIERLRDEKCKLELMLYNIGEGIVSCNEKREIIHVNDAALGFLEIGCWDTGDGVYERECKNRIIALLSRCMENAGRESEVYTNPSQRAIALLATPVLNAESVIIGAVCLLRDVSEETRLEQRRREYIANISHELRTPLTGIRGMIEPLIDGIIETEEEKQDSYLIIDKEAARLEKMIGEMLELSRLQDGKNIPEPERVNLYRPVSNAIRTTGKLAEKAGIEIVFNAEKDIYCLSIERRIEQLIVILLDNAISFTPEGGTITVTAGRGKCKAFISVKDTGVGIEPKHIPYIWERFYKADKSRMRTTGTGLGLAIAKCIVDMLGGMISVNSELGKGTEFIVNLPYYRE